MADTTPPVAPRLKILVPTNFSKKSHLALEFALTFTHTQAVGAEVFLFHSYDGKYTDFRHLDRVNAECVERMKQAVLTAIEALQRRGFSHSVETVHRRLSYGKPWLEILKVCGGVSADMIIMGTPSNTAFRRLVEKVPCTLVMVKDKDPTFVMD